MVLFFCLIYHLSLSLFGVIYSKQVVIITSEGNFSCSRTLEEKAMAPHSSTLAWKVPWTEEPGGLQSKGSLGLGRD